MVFGTFGSVFLKTYNLPEFVTSYIELNPRILFEIARSDPKKSYSEE